MSSEEDEFFLEPTHPILEILKLPMEVKMGILRRLAPMKQEDLEIYIVNSIRTGDLLFFEFLMINEKILCPDWKGIGSLMYQYLLCEACENSQPGIVLSLLKNIPDDHRLYEASDQVDPHLVCNGRKHVDYQWPMYDVGKSGSIECFKMLRIHAPISMEDAWCARKKAKKYGHEKLANYIKKKVPMPKKRKG